MAAPPPPSGLPSAPGPPTGLPSGFSSGASAPPPPAGLPSAGGYAAGSVPAAPSGLPGAGSVPAAPGGLPGPPPPPSGLPGGPAAPTGLPRSGTVGLGSSVPPPPPSNLPSRFGAGPSDAAFGGSMPPPPPMGLPSMKAGGPSEATHDNPPPPTDFRSLTGLGGLSSVKAEADAKPKANEWRQYLGDGAGEDDEDSQNEVEEAGDSSGEDSDPGGGDEARRAQDLDMLFKQQQAAQPRPSVQPKAQPRPSIESEDARRREADTTTTTTTTGSSSAATRQDAGPAPSRASRGGWGVDEPLDKQPQQGKKKSMLGRLFGKGSQAETDSSPQTKQLVSLLNEEINKYEDHWYQDNLVMLGREGVSCTKVGTNGKPYVRKLHVDTRQDVVEVRGGRGGSTGVLLEDLIDVRKGLTSPEFEKFGQRIKKSKNENIPAAELLGRSLVLQTPHRTYSFLFDSESQRDIAGYSIAFLLRSKSKGTGMSTGTDTTSGFSSPGAAPKEGSGKVAYPNGSRYDGQFHCQKRHGKGALTLSDGTRYDCEWKNDLRHGIGKENWPDGTTFEGSYVEGMRSGHGVMTWPEGSRYSGHFERGRANGEGQLVRTDGSIYSGHFSEDCMSGLGKMTWPDGVEYVGHFMSNRREGKGKMTWKTGKWKSYDGEWKDGMQHGHGTLTDHSNTEYAGVFHAGKLDRWIEDGTG